jgi:uncharacterized protein YdhG (YjbR/CyaY superfamily)
VDEYLARVPEPAHTTLNKVRAAIRAAAPKDATEAISYQIPTFKYKGSLLAFAAFSKHCSLFPMSLAVMETFKSELKDFDTSKGRHFWAAQAACSCYDQPNNPMTFPAAVPEIPAANVDKAAAYYVNTLGFTFDWVDDQGGIAGISRGIGWAT